MRRILLLAVVVALANGAKDQKQAESAKPYQAYYPDNLANNYPEEPLPGPHVLRSTRSRHIADENDQGPDVKKQNVIIRKTYDPDFYEPTIILDYRYMKTGGRDYTRGPGGQYLILPKGIRSNEHKEFENFDMLLEHLRLKQLAETEYRRAHYNKEGQY